MKNLFFISISFLSAFFSVGFVSAQTLKTTAIAVSTVSKNPLDLTAVNGQFVPTCNNNIYGSTRPVFFNLHFSCFPTNLRFVENPLAWGSNIRMTLKMSPASGDQEIKFDIPFNIVMPYYTSELDAAGVEFIPQPTNVSVTNGTISELTRARNTISFKLNNMRIPSAVAGEIDRGNVLNVFQKIEALQMKDPAALPGPYTGFDGPLVTEIRKDFSSDMCIYDIFIDIPGAAQPGQTPWYITRDESGFCGAWYSPIMLFTDSKLPKFTGRTEFKLSDFPTKTFWVEPNAPGYFLALDQNKNGKIDDGTELFGDGQGHNNGFEALSYLDTDKNGVIDRKDKRFNELLVWQDKNGNGISESEELQKVTAFGLVSINLKYKAHHQYFGQRASYRQASTFKFKSQDKIKEGRALDIWFNDVNRVKLSHKKNH